ncbi:hypothetical protein MFLAVUS_003434 [Mucor flavus]|uniref:Uncharacterized protein n=1 Tax=Mucor flavus TaxID=439312 RepID=A0ABP9YT25_9FUNG
MPTLSSLLFNQKQEHSSSCHCHCHHEDSILFTPTRWFPRIRRRSSSSSSVSSIEDHPNKHHISTEYILQQKHIEEFENLYSLAVDEMAYAIESQGSIYYSGDLLTATEAVDACLDRFRHLMQTLSIDRSHTFQKEWTDILFELRSRLDSLPFPLSE